LVPDATPHPALSDSAIKKVSESFQNNAINRRNSLVFKIYSRYFHTETKGLLLTVEVAVIMGAGQHCYADF